MMPKNPCAKRVTPETAYEVWQSYDGRWTYFVLKKYQSPEKEAANPFARWLVFVKSPAYPNGWTEDGYVSSIKRGTRHIDNPLAPGTLVGPLIDQTAAMSTDH